MYFPFAWDVLGAYRTEKRIPWYAYTCTVILSPMYAEPQWQRHASLRPRETVAARAAEELLTAEHNVGGMQKRAGARRRQSRRELQQSPKMANLRNIGVHAAWVIRMTHTHQKVHVTGPVSCRGKNRVVALPVRAQVPANPYPNSFVAIGVWRIGDVN